MWTEYIIAITHITSGDKHYTKCIMSLTAQLSCDTYYYHPPLQLRKQRFYEVRGGNSLVIQWLGVCTFTAEARVQFLVREIGSCKLSGMAEKEKKRELRGLTQSHTARKCINLDLNPAYNCVMLFYYILRYTLYTGKRSHPKCILCL